MKQILVGLDGSPRATRVLAVATTIARATGAKLTLVRSVGIPPDVPEDFWKATDEPLIQLLQRNAREALEVLASKAPKELLGGCEVIIGVPWQTVCERAREIGADLVVIGSHGYGGLDRVLGTTAAKIVNHASCSVLVVREAHAEAKH
jgi:nucleotide-binding universal stress UspA family protein